MIQLKKNLLRRLLRFLKLSGVKVRNLMVMGSLSFLSAGLEGMVAALMVPLAKGVLQSDFRFLKQTPVFEDIIYYLPSTWQNQNAFLFSFLVLLFLVLMVFKNILNYSASLYSASVNAWAVQRFQGSLYERYLSFGKLYYDQVSTSYLQNVLTANVSGVLGLIPKFQRWLFQLFQSITFLGILLYISWQLTIILVICLPIFRYSVTWLLEKIKKTANFEDRVRREHSRMFFNALMCIPLVKAYSNEGYEIERFNERGQTIAKLAISMSKKTNLVGPIQETVLGLIGIFLLGVMSLLYFQFQIGSVAHYAVFIYVLRRLNGLLVGVGEFNASLIRSDPSIDHLERMFENDNKYSVPDGQMPFSGLRNKIAIKRLSFHYIKNSPILHDLSFEIPQGKMTAIVGKSGSGKTSFIHILMRFYDCPPGQILFDGVDFRDFKIASLHEHMALVSQETYLLNDTLKNNFLYGVKRNIPYEELQEAIQKASLESFVKRLPQGLQTIVGDRGIRLSGGEKQRVSIARAFLRKPDILLLDEATSSLDSVTERQIQNALQSLIHGTTSIVVAHRLSTVKNADQIIVLEKGELLEKGTLPELLEKKGRFYEFWQEQKFD